MTPENGSRLGRLDCRHGRSATIMVLAVAAACLQPSRALAQSVPIELHAGLNLVSLPLSSLTTGALTSRELTLETGADFVARLDSGGRWKPYIPSLGTPPFSLETGRGYLVKVATARRPVVRLFTDSDGDGLPDEWERRFFQGDGDPQADPDGDGLENLREFSIGTNPASADTDNDGVSDLAELRAGTDPGRSSSSLKSASLAGLRGLPTTTAPGSEFVAWLDIFNPNSREITVTSAALVASSSRVTAVTSSAFPVMVAAAGTLAISFAVEVQPDSGVQTVEFGAVVNAREDRSGLSLSSTVSTGLGTMSVQPNGQALFKLIAVTDPYQGWAQFAERQGVFNSGAPHGPKARVWINGAAVASLEGAGMSNGSVIVKENLKDNGTGLQLQATTVMYKVRGYDASGGDWFWAQFAPGGAVMAEGVVGMCASCHAGASSNDYIFLHQFPGK
ncbi:MAG: cytochrome P460 family protein [Candidatus Wallbacteria bacterium]|nr:cytochrome P460 family protein [Candidatus Wallbacteria bacterium]